MQTFVTDQKCLFGCRTSSGDMIVSTQMYLQDEAAQILCTHIRLYCLCTLFRPRGSPSSLMWRSHFLSCLHFLPGSLSSGHLSSRLHSAELSSLPKASSDSFMQHFCADRLRCCVQMGFPLCCVLACAILRRAPSNWAACSCLPTSLLPPGLSYQR